MPRGEQADANTYKKGAIVRIGMQNFMAYEGPVHFNPGPRLNVVLGPNGTGKSTIVGAIVVGLNGSTKILGRADNIVDFIRYGTDSCWVEIELYNPDGDNTVIRREIEKLHVANKVSNKWKLDGRTTTGADVSKRMKSLNVQIDNLCQFLPQDQVQNFSTMKNHELLRETERAVLGQETLNEHDELVKMQKEGNSFEQQRAAATEMLEDLQKQHDSLKEVVESQQERIKHLDQVKLLEGKLLWTKTEQLIAECITKKDDKKTKKAEFRALQKDLEPREAALNAAVARENELTQSHRDAMKVWKQKEKAKERHIDKVESISDSVRENTQEVRSLHKRLEKDRKRLADEEKAFAEIQEKIGEYPPEEESTNRMAELGKAVRAATSRYKKLEDECNDMKDEIGKYQMGRKRAQDKLAKENNMKQQRLRKLQQLDRTAYDAYCWLNQGDNRSKLFRRKVWGPVMLELNVQDRQHEAYVENAIPRWVKYAFVTECAEDARTLQRICKDEKKWSISSFNAEISAQRQARPLPEDKMEQLKKYGIVGYLDESIECSDTVKKGLCTHGGIHKMFVGSAAAEKSLNMRNSPLQQFLDDKANCPQGYRLYTPPHGYQATRSQYGSRSMSVSMWSLKQSIMFGGGQADADVIQNCHRQIEECNAQLAELGKVSKAKYDETAHAHAEARKLENERNAHKHNKMELLKLKKMLQRKEEKLVRLRNECQSDVQKEEKTLKRRRKILLNKYMDALVALGVLTKELLELSMAMDSCMLGRAAAKEITSRIKTELGGLRQRVQDAEQAYNEASAMYEELKRETLIVKAKVEEEHPMTDELAKSYQQLPDEIADIEASISESQEMANAVVANPEAMGKFEKVKTQLEAQRIETEQLAADATSREARLDEKRRSWELRVETVVDKISKKFSYFFQGNGCVGEVRLHKDEYDYSKWEVQIWVKFREGEGQTLHKLEGSVQSGGERTVSTICYLMALQSMTNCPFRLVDEINQGMDEKNERRIFKTIVSQSSGRNLPQYFLITPKLVTGLQYSDDVTVLFVLNGYGAPTHSDWNIGEIIRQKRKLLGSAGRRKRQKA